jgi:membrane associated rhomboid family serine protease
VCFAWKGDSVIPLRDATPTRRVPYVAYGLIAVNVAVFLYQESLSARLNLALVFRYGATPALVTADFGAYAYTLVTSMFLHGGWVHLLSNMLYLWIFGNNVEDRLGALRFVLFYFGCGIAASAAQIAIDPSSEAPMIGASGAISGVLGAYIVLFPNARILTLVFFFFLVRLVELRAAWLLGFWFVMQLVSGLGTLGMLRMGGVAFFAHIGGFVAGFLVAALFVRRRRRPVLRDDDAWISRIGD